MSRAASVLRKLFILLMGEGAARVLGVVTFAVLARSLGVDQLGIFSFAMSLALVLECGMDLGQNAHIGRIVAEDPADGPNHFSLAAGNKVTLALAIGAATVVVMSISGFERQEIAIVVLLIVWAAGLSVLDSLRSTARSLGLFRVDSIANGGESLARLLAICSVWALSGGLTHYAVAFSIESWLAATICWVYMGIRHPGLLRFPDSFVPMRAFLKEAAPFGIAIMSLSAFYHFDQVLVRTLAGTTANGLYGAAARVSFSASVIGGLLALVIYPDLSRMRGDVKLLGRYLSKAVALAALIGLVTGIAVFAAAEPILVLLFGEEFAVAAPLLRILALVVAFRGISAVALYATNALGRERQVLWVALVFVLGNVSCNLILVPKFGAQAAAWISGIGEVALTIVLLVVSFGYIRSGRELSTEGS